MPYALPATQRDYAPETGYRRNFLYRSYRRYAGRQDLLAPLLGLIMYAVLVVMMSAEIQFSQPSTGTTNRVSSENPEVSLNISSVQLPGGS